MAKILISASSNIQSSTWIERCLTPVFERQECEVSQFGDNEVLSRLLRERGILGKPLGHGNSANRRSEIRKALSNADYLLLMWDGRSFTQLLFEARLISLPMKLFAFETALVVNKDRGDDFDLYIGRGTPWGNPYAVGKLEGQHEREEAIELYRRHFQDDLLKDQSLRRGIIGMRGLRIACHCKPLACHGDVIAEYLNSLDPYEVGDSNNATSPT